MRQQRHYSHVLLPVILLLLPPLLLAIEQSPENQSSVLPPCVHLCILEHSAEPFVPHLCRSPALLSAARNCTFLTCMGEAAASRQIIDEWFTHMCDHVPEREFRPMDVYTPGVHVYNATKANIASRLGAEEKVAVGLLTVVMAVVALLVLGGSTYVWVGWRNRMVREFDARMEMEDMERRREERERWRKEYRWYWGEDGGGSGDGEGIVVQIGMEVKKKRENE
ncbi:hypothetical protein DFP73DRAFT_598115 [Morchella snyderi]|nr:hypothetical protein DFP73DRAFT_598115 [Morchella snyderi]